MRKKIVIANNGLNEVWIINIERRNYFILLPITFLTVYFIASKFEYEYNYQSFEFTTFLNSVFLPGFLTVMGGLVFLSSIKISIEGLKPNNRDYFGLKLITVLTNSENLPTNLLLFTPSSKFPFSFKFENKYLSSMGMLPINNRREVIPNVFRHYPTIGDLIKIKYDQIIKLRINEVEFKFKLNYQKNPKLIGEVMIKLVDENLSEMIL